jgi:hypothetical protein
MAEPTGPRQEDARESEAREADRDTELLRRAELALTQLHNRHGLEADQAATLTAIRLRLEGRERASLEDLLRAGKDVAERDPLADALGRGPTAPSLEDAVERSRRKRGPSLEDLL